MAHKIDDLRDHLFATLTALRDKENPMDVERAKAIAEVGRVIVDSAKVEVQHLDLVGGRGSGFLPEPDQLGSAPQRPALTAVPQPGHAISRGK
jgi:hypothetical protein